MNKLEVTIETFFRASHRLTAPEHRKQEVGDVCDVVHGHEYFLRATFKGLLDPISGIALSRKTAQSILKEKIHNQLHNQDLNKCLGNTSGEKIAEWCFQQLRNTSIGERLIHVELQETKKNGFYYSEP